MNEPEKSRPSAGVPDLAREVGRKETRRLKGKRHKPGSVLAGLGMFGVVGWSIVLPTLAGAALGAWIDRHYSGQYSWTLMLVGLGVILGCLSAWYWIDREQREIEREEEKKKNHE